ncbi:N-acetyltransferase family protein [Parapedobacter sp.]
MAQTNVTLHEVTEVDLPIIRQLAHDIWWPTYEDYIDHGQIRLMLKLIYSDPALRRQLETGQRFSLALRGDVAIGFVGFRPKPGNPKTMRIEKLYVKPSEQGKGTGRLMIDHVAQAALSAGYSSLELNVNRGNPASKFYGGQGFVIVDTVDTPYHGYVLNDYVMQKKLRHER